MWAMMPILRYRSSGVVRAMTIKLRRRGAPRSQSVLVRRNPAAFSLPSIMREGFVRIGHAVRVFPFLDRDAAIVGGVEQFARKAFFHRVFRAPARARNQPADRQRLAAVGANLDRHLIGGAADAARAHLD